MSHGPGPRRRLIGGIVLGVVGVLIGLYVGYGARGRALDQAARQAQAGLAPTLEIKPRSQALQKRVVAWIGTSDVDAVYITVFGPDRRLLASAGAWSGWFDGWASKTRARRWRAWAYRSFCAEGDRRVTNIRGVTLAELHLGIAWWTVLIGAGPAFWLALVVALSGLGLALRERKPFMGVPRGSRTDESGGPAARFKTRWPGSARSANRPSDGFQPIGQWPVKTASGIAPGELSDTAPSDPESVVPATPPAPADHPDVPSAKEPATAPEPAFRFLPLWRGELLAGAFVALARPGGEPAEARWLSIEQLAESSRDEAERRVLASWLVQRLAAFQANWRGLELPRVPLLVGVPSTLLDFDGAAETWARALQGLDEVVEDIVLCVDHIPGSIRSALAVRWAVAEPDTADGPRYRLIVGQGETTAASEPIRMPDPDAPVDEHGQTPLPPREFARLLRQHEFTFSLYQPLK